MKSYQFIIILFFTLFPAFTVINAQGFLSTEGKTIVNENGDPIILRAMGLGGWMLQEGYMLQTAGFASAQYQIKDKISELIGEEDTELFYDKWLENHCQKIDIDSLSAWGFNAVRLPMHYNLFTLPIQEEPVEGEHTWLDKGFELTDSLVSWCRQNNMYVLLDLHAAPGGQGYEGAISDYNPDFPSLWESKANRDKTVALWKRIAEYYANEPWIMGYDLINETNWNMTNGAPLRALHKEITDSIRTVDNKHIIFIEGNWFANDFTGLTPPWDDNMVYSPHKYWSKNETADIQWVLTIRDQYNVPIYFGESGENSNPWFTDAIRLFEEEGLGWAWWPMKKVESISCPLSVIKTPEYEYLLNYWNGNGPKPSAPFAKATLMELAENFKLENCVFQKDVIDAMFRQVNSTESIPYRVQDIPGVVFASDFSMGNNGYAYFDLDAYDYHVTTGNFTAWNSGWAYRNDAVDIQEIDDNVNSNGLGVGWMSNQEWMQYDIRVEETAVYDLNIRYASNGTDGKFHLEKDGLAISPIKSIPNSGGWENWETTTLSNLVMTADMETFILAVDEQGFNLSSIEFIKKSELEDIATTYLMAETLNKEAVRLILNKPMVDELPDNPAGFSIKVNNVSIEITELILNPENNRAIDMKVNYNFKSTDQIRISYTGDQIKSVDNIPLSNFTNLNVNNGIENYHPVPGKIEAEDYHFQLGVQLENCSDDGGGKNIGYLDQGDYLDYFIDVHGSGTYDVTYRTAAESAIGKVELQLINDDGSSSLLHSLVFSPTGGWQNWRFTTKSVELPKGKHKIRLVIVNPQFNMNWFEFNFVTPVEDLSSIEGLKVFPNPGSGRFHLNGQLQESDHFYFSLISMEGRLIDQWEIKNSTRIDEIIDISALRNGKYNLQVKNSSGKSKTLELLKLRE